MIFCLNDTLASKKVRTNVCLDAESKHKAQEIFKRYGMGLNDVFNIFLALMVTQQGIPFNVKIPNEKTAQSIKNARSAKNISKVLIERE